MFVTMADDSTKTHIFTCATIKSVPSGKLMRLGTEWAIPRIQAQDGVHSSLSGATEDCGIILQQNVYISYVTYGSLVHC